jgi:TetR/AcrR family transcriptional regulator, mexJK operon transcriptional repressor
MEAATSLFLRGGYLGTSMDEIAATAGVSKQTVYTHFADKEQLFTELVLRNTELADQFTAEMLSVLDDTNDVESGLRELARRYITSVIQPRVTQLRRLVIAEAGRFPDLARTYYERVPQRTVDALATRLDTLASRGLLRIDDPQLAATHLAWLILGMPMDRAMFHATDDALPPADLEHLAEEAVRVFLAAYGASPRPRPRQTSSGASS